MKPEWVDPFDILLHQQECGSCKYFNQHYTQAETGEYFPTDFGECSLCPSEHGNIRRDTSISCEKYAKRNDLKLLPDFLAAAEKNNKTKKNTRTLSWTRKRFNKGLLRVRLALTYEQSDLQHKTL